LEWLATNLGGGGVAAGGTGARLSTNDDAKRDDDDDDEASVLEAIPDRRVGQRQDTACDEDTVDVSVGVDVDTDVGVRVHDQGVNLGVGLNVGSHFPRLLGSPSEIWESYDLSYHLYIHKNTSVPIIKWQKNEYWTSI